MFGIGSQETDFQEKMKSLWSDVEDMTAMYRTDNLKLENPLSELELNCEIRYMLTKRQVFKNSLLFLRTIDCYIHLDH